MSGMTGGLGSNDWAPHSAVSRGAQWGRGGAQWGYTPPSPHLSGLEAGAAFGSQVLHNLLAGQALPGCVGPAWQPA